MVEGDKLRKSARAMNKAPDSKVRNTIILGAYWGKDEETEKERWFYPQPIYYARHFRNAAIKRLFKVGEMTVGQAYVNVPIFRGESYRENNRRRSYAKQKHMHHGETLEEIEEMFIDG